MLRSAGESLVSAGADGACANPAIVPRTNSRRAAIRFIKSSLSFEDRSGKVRDRRLGSGHEAKLFHRTNIIGLAAATLLSRPNVVAVTSAVRWFHPRERGAVSHFDELHTIADARAVFLRIDQDAAHGTGGN